MSERKLDNGGPAFPNLRRVGMSPATCLEYAEDISRGGMSLRDWFAGQALVGMCANSKTALSDLETGLPVLATISYRTADAMLAEKAKGDSR